MNRYFSVYFHMMRAALIVSVVLVGYACVISGFQFNTNMLLMPLVMFLTLSAIFALLSWNVVRRHRNAVIRIAGEATEETLKTSHSQTIDLPMAAEQAWKQCKKALLLFMLKHIEIEDAAQMTVQASIGYKTEMIATRMDMDRTSIITMQVEPIDAANSRVTVSSRPPNPKTGTIDFGSNLDHVKRIVRFFESVSDAYNEGHQR